MRRWIPRTLQALLVSVALPAAAAAEDAPAQTLPPPAAPGAVAPAPAGPGTVVVVPNGAYYFDPYHAATPYNPTVNGRPIPNPAFNRPVFTLPCENPNQNFAPYTPQKWDGGQKLLNKFKGGGGDCGCDGGVKHPVLGVVMGKGMCSKGGDCTTCCNTSNFIWGSSRTYFGESSREFFERPPAVDGLKTHPVKYAPPPAPAAYIPAYVIVPPTGNAP